MLRRLALLVVILVLAPVVLAGVALAVLQTGPGRALVESGVARLTRDTGNAVSLTGLSGALPLRPRVARIEVADARGVWLRVEGARLDLDGRSLLRLRPAAGLLAAERIEVLRLPEGQPSEAPAEPVDLGVLLRLPPVSVERLEVPEIVVAPAVLGEELRLAADGSLALGQERGAARAQLDLRRLTETTTRATLELLVEPERDWAKVLLEVRDDSGLLGRVLDRPVGRITARLDGSGPLDRWTGSLTARAEGLLSADLALDASLREPLRLRLDGAVEPAPALIPADAEAIMGPRVTVSAEAGLAADGTWSVRDLAIGTAQLALSGELSGSPTRAAAGRLQLSAPRLETAGAVVADLRADLTVEPAAAPGGWQVAIDATSRPQRAAGQELTALGEVGLAATAELAPEGAGEVRIARLATALGSASGEARFGPELAGLTARVSAEIPDLRALGALAGPEAALPAGTARLTLVGERPDVAGPADLHARLELSDLDGLPGPAAVVVGRAPGLDLAATIAPGGRIAPIRASADLEHGTLRATGRFDAATAEADLLLTGDLPDLAPLGAALGTALGGAVVLEASVRGRLEQPALTARIEARDLAAGGQRIDRVEVRLEDAALAPVPESRITVRASRGDAPLELGTTVRLDGSSLTARDLQVTGPGLSLAGEASVDTATGLATGQLRGTVADLARLRPWHEQALGGAAELDVAASAEGGTQGLRLRLVARDLTAAGAGLRRAELSGSVADLAGATTLDLAVDLDGARSGEARLDRARLTLQGPARTPRYRLQLQGDAGGPLQVNGGGDLALADGGVRVGVAELRARWRDTDVVQSGRATVAAGAAGWSVQGLALQSGPARLTTDLAVSAQNARGAVRLRDLPAAMLAAAGAPPLQGTIGAEIDLAGTAADPQLRFALRADDLVYVGAAGQGVPPADLELDGTLAGGRLESNATVSGLAEKPISASATLPVVLTLAPFQAVLDQGRPLRARFVLDGEVSRLVPRHLLDERRLTGAVRGELRVAGTLAAPRFAGSLRLDGGAYDDAVTGTTLRDITLEIVGRDREIVVERLTASDGAGGTLDADARVLVDDRFELPWQAQLRLARLRALRNDLIQATLTGRIDATGSQNRAELRGRIEVERAEIAVPSRFAGSIPVIAVQDATEPAAGPPPRAPVAFTSSLAIDVIAPGQVFVRGRGIESEWQADLQVRGAIDAPRLTGAIVLRRGQFDFLGRRLKLTRGTIGFTGATPPDPTLDVRGEAAAAEVTAVVEIGGVVSKPEITLSSEPALPQDEVLARLLFGRDTSRISATQGLQIANALRELAGLSSGPGVIDRLRSGIGLDTLDFSTEAGETGVRAGRYLSDEVYVEVQRGVEPGSGRATVEIELTPNLRVQSEVTDRATSGVGLQWRMDY